MTFAFNLYGAGNGYTYDAVYNESHLTDFYNLKNKSEGPRRIGFRVSVCKGTNGAGEVAYRAEFRTTLNGQRYQSSKYGQWRATEAECRADLDKTIVAATKRYRKLSADPVKNGIAHLPE
jgi:hypothetical protein